MSNPNVNPNPSPQPVYYRHRRSLAGPLILIIIGLVFLLHNFGVRIPIWHLFGRFWPLLLILWGVIRLIEYSVAPRYGYGRSGLGTGSIFLLILIVIIGLSAHYSSDVNWGGVRDQLQLDDDLGGMFGSAYTFDDNLEQVFPAKGSLRVVSDRGAMTVAPSEDDKLHVVVHKKLRADNQNNANKYHEQTKPQITVNGTSVLLNANTNGAGDHGVESDMEIQVPREAALDIASKSGDVTVTDHANDVKIALQRGDVSLTNIAGAAAINLDKGSIRASKISGDVDIEGHVDDVTLDEVGGAVHLNGDFFNDIRLSKIAKAVSFKSSRSDMSLGPVAGDLDIDRDSVRGDGVSGPGRIVTTSKEIHLENVSGDMQVETTNGDIEVQAARKLPVGRMTISGRHGDITLTLPPNAGFQLDATTRRGDISSDWDVLKVESSGGSSTAKGTVGNGVGKLQINSETGDIRISKG